MAAVVVSSLRSRQLRLPKIKFPRSIFEIAEIADAISENLKRGVIAISTKSVDEFEVMPTLINISSEKEAADDIFFEDIVLKADQALKPSLTPSPWLDAKAYLCRERVYFTMSASNGSCANEVVLEDIPLSLITSIHMAFLNVSNQDKLAIDIIAEPSIQEQFWGKMGIRSQERMKHLGKGMHVEDPPIHILTASCQSLREEAASFLRLSIRCSGD